MAKRRGNREGSIYQDSDGRWRGSVDLGYKNGKRHRKLLSGRTRAEVAEKVTAALRTQHLGLPLVGERQTVAQFLARWLEQYAKPKLSPKTFVSYEQLVRVHLVPALGLVPLSKLAAPQVDAFLNEKRLSLCDECGHKFPNEAEAEKCPDCGSLKLARRGLSARTVQYLHAVLRCALNQALKWDILPRNVAALVDPPSAPRSEIVPYTPDEARQFLEAIKGDRLEAVYTVAIAIGLREGEALGLRWPDVDLESGRITVRFQLQRINKKLILIKPKRGSRRPIELPAVLRSALHVHRARQEQERLAAGSRWQDTGFVFTTSIGTPIDQRNLLRHFGRMVQIASVKKIRFHDLRHTCASLLLAQGVSFKAIQDILGHADLRTTMNLYAHLYPEARREAAEKMDAILNPALELTGSRVTEKRRFGLQ